jgi:uncharacterized protein DUF3592
MEAQGRCARALWTVTMSGPPSFFRLAFGSIQFIAGIVFLFIGILFLLIAVPAMVEARRYQAEGREADAVVLSKDVRRATANSSTAYEVSYRFTAPDGQSYDHAETIDVDQWERLQKGDRLRVRYLPDRLDSVTLKATPRILEPAIGLAVALPLALTGSFFLVRTVSSTLKRWRLFRSGQVAEAVVTDVRETNFQINRRPQWMIDFTYRDHLGQVREGSSHHVPLWQAENWHVGDKGIVRFDPARPEQSVWIGK